ncbi:MAG: hypothetical protein ACOVSW_01790 [Candidatus Kapaibacteriota bacterium]
MMSFSDSLQIQTLRRLQSLFVCACYLLFVDTIPLHSIPRSTDNLAVNAVIGDQSYVAKFGTLPSRQTDEKERITTHLEYVEMLLRKRHCRHLSGQQQQQRIFLLDKLREYRIRAEFPRNEKYSCRRPRFIDSHGNICAVGYLVEQSAGRALAEAINNKHQYDYIAEMKIPELETWIQASGLTREECAMIQPAYSTWGISPEYATISSILILTNGSLGTLNALELQKPKSDKIIAVLGLASGCGSIVNGIIGLQYPNANAINAPFPDGARQALSYFNMGIGAASTILSAINLFTTPTTENKNVSWGAYSFSVPQTDQLGLGIKLTATF